MAWSWRGGILALIFSAGERTVSLNDPLRTVLEILEIHPKREIKELKIRESITELIRIRLTFGQHCRKSQTKCPEWSRRISYLQLPLSNAVTSFQALYQAMEYKFQQIFSSDTAAVLYTNSSGLKHHLEQCDRREWASDILMALQAPLCRGSRKKDANQQVRSYLRTAKEQRRRKGKSQPK
jgi:hypothetical protein